MVSSPYTLNRPTSFAFVVMAVASPFGLKILFLKHMVTVRWPRMQLERLKGIPVLSFTINGYTDERVIIDPRLWQERISITFRCCNTSALSIVSWR